MKFYTINNIRYVVFSGTLWREVEGGVGMDATDDIIAPRRVTSLKLTRAIAKGQPRMRGQNVVDGETRTQRIKRLKSDGMSLTAIAEQEGITVPSVLYHISKSENTSSTPL